MREQLPEAWQPYVQMLIALGAVLGVSGHVQAGLRLRTAQPIQGSHGEAAARRIGAAAFVLALAAPALGGPIRTRRFS